MKKLFCMLAVCVLMLGLSACGGKVSDVSIPAYESDIYTDAEIDEAIDAAMAYFKAEFSGCTLTEITYAGDEATQDHQDFAQLHNADEAIVLISSFDVDASGGDGSLNPNSTYEGWKWIMVRNNGGAWRHADHGYG